MAKVCVRCRVQKESHEFSPQKGHSDGLSSWCRACKNKHVVDLHRKKKDADKLEPTKMCTRCKIVKDKTEFNASRSNYNRDGYATRCKQCCADKHNFQETRKADAHLRRTYDLTLSEYDSLLSEQNGCCAICGGINPNGHRLAVDHDHATGKNRGLLCISCNTKLGFLELHWLVIQEYLSRFGQNINRFWSDPANG